MPLASSNKTGHKKMKIWKAQDVEFYYYLGVFKLNFYFIWQNLLSPLWEVYLCVVTHISYKWFNCVYLN